MHKQMIKKQDDGKYLTLSKMNKQPIYRQIFNLSRTIS